MLDQAFRHASGPTTTHLSSRISLLDTGLLEWVALLLDLWGPGMTISPAHRQILSELSPSASDTVLTKWRYSVFHKSQLKSLLAVGGRDQLIITGVYAHVGCLMTAVDAFTQDIQPFIVSDGVADFSREEHDLCLSYAASNCAVVAPASRLLQSLQVSVTAR